MLFFKENYMYTNKKNLKKHAFLQKLLENTIVPTVTGMSLNLLIA